MNHGILTATLTGLTFAMTPLTLGADVETAIDALETLDVVTISVDFEDTPLDVAVDELSARLPLPLRADWDALVSLGIDDLDTVTIRYRDTTVSTVLAAMAIDLGDGFERPVLEYHAGQMILTTVAATAGMHLTDVYDVRDLVAADGLIDTLQAEVDARHEDDEASFEATDDEAAATSDDAADQGEAPPTDDDDDGDLWSPQSLDLDQPIDQAADPAMAGPPLSPAERLMLLIMEHVDPESWLRYGGDRSKLSEQGGLVVVTATASTHRRFREAIDRLRMAHPAAIGVEAVLLDLPGSTLARVSRRYQGRPGKVLAALRLEPDVVQVWQSRVITRMGQAGQIETSEADVSTVLGVTPDPDPVTGQAQLSIDFTLTVGTSRQNVESVIPFFERNAGTVLELPAPGADRTLRRVLILRRIEA